MQDGHNLFNLTGRVAIITGAGSGIGSASAQMLAGAGAFVVCADLAGAAAKATADQIIESGGSAEPVEVDVTNRDAVERVVDVVFEAHGRLDVIANIAGIIATNLVLDTSEEEFFGCQAAARVMVEQGSGSIINMSSGAIDTPKENLVSYAVAKAGVAQLTKTLAVEVGPHGVRANAVAPGFVVTPMTSRHFTLPDGTVDESLKEATITPMRDQQVLTKVGAPQDIAAAVWYLASDAAAFVTGQIIRPNGGVSMPW
jgi:3-oxoacyl-[acyl-carrier protein] reductase